MDKITAIQKITEALRSRVVCRNPKQRQSKVFRQICMEVFEISQRYTEVRNAGILIENIKKEKYRLYQSAFKYGKDHWTKEATKEVIAIISRKSLLQRLWWAIDSGKMDISEDNSIKK